MRTALRTTMIAMALIVAIGIAGTAANTSMVWAETPSQQAAEPPSKPQGLDATASYGQVVLTWNDPGDSITGYVILRRVRVNNQGGDFDVLIGNTASAATTYTDSTVAASTTYTYRIKAINEHGVSERSRWSHIDTPAAPGQEEQQAAEPPDKPRGLEAAASHGRVVLTWDDPQDDSITGYVILRRVRVNDTGGDFDVLVANTASAATTYTDTTVAASTTYTYRIKAINGAGVSERSLWVHVDTPAAPAPEEEQAAEPPDKPTGLEAAASHGRVVLTWDDPQDDSITGYVILRRVRVNDTGGDFDVLVANTASAATTYTDTTVAASTTYTYRIKAINGAGVSERSLWVHVDTPAAPAPEEEQAAEPPDKPTGLTTEATHDSVTLTWDDPGDDTIAGYVILRRVPGVDPEGQFDELEPDTGTDATTYTDDTVSAETRYTYRIKAINEHGVSERSRWSHINVPAAPQPEEEQAAEPPARPTGLASAAASDLVLLSWADPQDDSVTGYRILRADVVDGVQGEFAVLIEDTSTTETSYADDTVENDRVYVYRVLAIGPGGVSEPSRDVRVRTTTPVAPPNRLRGLPSQGTPQPRQSVSEPSGDDFPDDNTTSGRLEVGGSVTGNIDSNGDVDAFAIELVQGRTYRFDLEGSETEQGTLADPEIPYIFVGSSFLQNSDDDDGGEGKNARLTYTLPAGTQRPTGTYYISVQEEGNNATGTYRLSMERVAGSGFGRTYRVEGNLQQGGSLSGTLDVPTDYGTNSYYFALEDLEVGRYTVDFGTGTIDSIHATLRRDGQDDTMIIRAQPDPTGRKGIDSHSFDVRPGMEGTHYVLLEMRMGDSGNYTATLEKVLSSLRVGGSVRGDLPSIANDPEASHYGYIGYMQFFSVDLEAGQTYRVDIEGEDTCGNCTMDYTMLGNIQAPDGSYVEDTNNLHAYGGGEGRNTRYVFTADQDGTHFLYAGGRLLAIYSDKGVYMGSRFRSGTFKVSIREVN